MLRRSISILKSRGVSVLLRAAAARLRGMLANQAKSFDTYQERFADKAGIEIGGPSSVFKRDGIFPIYPIAGSLDNCDFSHTTVWAGDAICDQTYCFDRDRPAGRQHIAEATALGAIPSQSYDFLLSSHVLEHCANPILALTEWKRLLKKGGMLVLLLPNKQHTFDHRRPVTTLQHMITDFETGMTEDDVTHVAEVLALHDFVRDPDAGDMESFKLRCIRNIENRCLHHHVFDAPVAIELIRYAGLTIHSIEEIEPHHILLVTSSATAQQYPENHG
ncbi:MAG: methyltransferase domain-containing protein [Nitrososphaera sp.]